MVCNHYMRRLIIHKTRYNIVPFEINHVFYCLLLNNIYGVWRSKVNMHRVRARVLVCVYDNNMYGNI